MGSFTNRGKQRVREDGVLYSDLILILLCTFAVRAIPAMPRRKVSARNDGP